MRFVICFIFLVTVIGIRASSHETSINQVWLPWFPTLSPAQNAWIQLYLRVLKRYSDRMSPLDRISPIMLTFLRARFASSIRDMLLAAATTTTTTTTTVTTTGSPIPDDFQEWMEYKGCRYQPITPPAELEAAFIDCQKQGAVLAHKNVRTAADRLALFRNHLGLTGAVWLPLFKNDGDDAEEGVDFVWVEKFVGEDTITSPYVADSGTIFTGESAGSFGTKAIDINYSTIQYAAEEAKSFYVCEYCPP